MASDNLNTVFSNISCTGGVQASAGTFGTLSLGTSAVTNSTVAGTSSVGTLAATSGISVGGGTLITKISSGYVSVVTMTVTGAVSLTTTATITGLAVGDKIFVHPPASGLSVNLSLCAWVDSTNVVKLQFSNSSSANAIQAGPVNYHYVSFRS